MANPKITWSLLEEACSNWVTDNAPSLGAALAFYTTFSLAPILIVTTMIAGAVLGREVAQGRIQEQIQALMGYSCAAAVRTILQGFNRPTFGASTSAIGIGTALLGASGAFVELQSALNKIWKVDPKSESLLVCTMRKRFVSFGLVLGTGCLLLVSSGLSAALAVAGRLMGLVLSAPAFLVEGIHSLLSFAVMTFLFATIFKVLPDTEIAWNDVWLGATMTSLFFTIGKVLIGIYLGVSTMVAAYGAAASLVVLLIWIYYSAQIFLFGAEFTHIYANRLGSRNGLPALARTGRMEPMMKAQKARASGSRPGKIGK